jgi:DNA-binding CsgD family transcriptional regulator
VKRPGANPLFRQTRGKLTVRQRQVMELRAAGVSFREIGRRLGMSAMAAWECWRWALAKAEKRLLRRRTTPKSGGDAGAEAVPVVE